jgi:hypothetical protein
MYLSHYCNDGTSMEQANERACPKAGSFICDLLSGFFGLCCWLCCYLFGRIGFGFRGKLLFHLEGDGIGVHLVRLGCGKAIAAPYSPVTTSSSAYAREVECCRSPNSCIA